MIRIPSIIVVKKNSAIVYVCRMHIIHFKTQGAKLVAFEHPKICQSSHEMHHVRCKGQSFSVMCNIAVHLSASVLSSTVMLQ